MGNELKQLKTALKQHQHVVKSKVDQSVLMYVNGRAMVYALLFFNCKPLSIILS